jgi:hypothetical protein
MRITTMGTTIIMTMDARTRPPFGRTSMTRR